jgi:methylglyoxal synthase
MKVPYDTDCNHNKHWILWTDTARQISMETGIYVQAIMSGGFGEDYHFYFIMKDKTFESLIELKQYLKMKSFW